MKDFGTGISYEELQKLPSRLVLALRVCAQVEDSIQSGSAEKMKQGIYLEKGILGDESE